VQDSRSAGAGLGTPGVKSTRKQEQVQILHSGKPNKDELSRSVQDSRSAGAGLGTPGVVEKRHWSVS